MRALSRSDDQPGGAGVFGGPARNLMLVTLLWLFGAGYAFSTVEPGAFWVFGLGLVAIAVALCWLTATIMLCRRITQSETSWSDLRTSFWACWLATPALGMVGFVFLVTDVDLLIRLRLSEAALVGEAERLLASGGSAQTNDAWIGLFKVQWGVVQDNGSVRFVTDLPWMFDEGGLYYDPAGVVGPTSAWPEERSSLYGPWRRFYLQD